MENSKNVTYPDMALVKQKLESSGISNLPETVMSVLSDLPVSNMVHPGETVAVAIGSRGINRIDSVALNCLGFLKELGLKPFIVPAMGSHGGGTTEGQVAVLAKLGITESSMGVPVYPDMDVAPVDRLSNGLNIFLSKRALEADHIVVINRVKSHTKFSADIESGICKMLTIGLGKATGAAEYHRCSVEHTFGIIEDAARVILKQCKILFGLSLIEDGYGKLARVEAVLPESLIEREKKLLMKATGMMARIPFDDLDVLIIDFFGKNISGIGMDSNVTGRHRDIVGDFYRTPNAKRIFVRDLSPGSDGNGNGIGLADITTKRLVDALDLKKTYLNAVTAISLEKAAIPMHFDTDRQCLDVCIKTVGLESTEKARIIRIKNTASLELLQVSKTLEQAVISNPSLERITPWEPIRFDQDENLMPISSYP